MLEQTGRVLAVRADAIEVCARAAGDCALCAAGRGCGGGLIGGLLRRGQDSVIAKPGPRRVSVGDTVRLRLPGPRLLEAASVAYLVPLAGLFLVVALQVLAGVTHDLWLAAGAAGGVCAGALVASRWLRRGGLRRFAPTVFPVDDE